MSLAESLFEPWVPGFWNLGHRQPQLGLICDVFPVIAPGILFRLSPIGKLLPNFVVRMMLPPVPSPIASLGLATSITCLQLVSFPKLKDK